MTRTFSPRLGTYAALVAIGLLASLALGRADVVVLVAPFAVFVALALALSRGPQLRVAFSLSRERLVEEDTVDALLELSAPTTVERLDFVLAVGAELEPDPPPGPWAVHLTAGDRRDISIALRASRWGAYAPGDVVVKAHDRFDLCTYEGRVNCAVALRVYPQPARLRRLVSPLATQPWAGSQTARAKGEGIEFADLRPFQYGDHVRRINWRASARRGTVLLTESNPERTSDVVLLLDSYADVRHAGSGALDRIVRAAASLAQAHLSRRDRVGVITLGGGLSWLVPSAGDRHLYQIVDSLIETAITRSYQWPDVTVLPPRSLPPKALLVALTPFIDDRIVRALTDLRARGFDMIVVEVSARSHVAPPLDREAQLALRLWSLARAARRHEFERLGVPAVEWHDDDPFDAALGEVSTYPRSKQNAHV